MPWDKVSSIVDEDGFGDPNVSVSDCTQPNGYVTNSNDCDDADPNINPNASELCDGVDNDCNNAIDDNVQAADASLTTLSATGLTLVPLFDPNTFSYTAEVCDLAETTLSATAANAFATVSGIGTFNLNEGLNTLNITVDACGIAQVYTIEATAPLV